MRGSIDLQREYGDYQTPVWFCEQVCNYLKKEHGLQPSRILEPSCGIGNFLLASKNVFPSAALFGIEINSEYAKLAKEKIGFSGKIYCESLFDFCFGKISDDLSDNGDMLIIGNPPWANNSTLSSADSNNLPIKSNFKKLRGIEAITGSANFDICEYMLLQLLDYYRDSNATIAMLCKPIVARNVYREIARRKLNCSLVRVLSIDAKKVFGVSADGCLLVIQLSKDSCCLPVCNVSNFESPDIITSQFGFRNGKFYSQLENPCLDLDGTCCFEWRQGIKHDCSKIMELSFRDGNLTNGIGETVYVESDMVYPLIKSSHIKQPIITEAKKAVIVTQHAVGQETGYIEWKYPEAWQYLSQHAPMLEKRKSIIYRNSPRFSIFGVGDYSFAPYKVGVSGFYKEPRFSLIYGEKPIMLDDTCYFLSFCNYDEAYVAMLLLNSPPVVAFLKSIAFFDSKRPYTKKVLERIDFKKCLSSIGINELIQTEQTMGLSPYITDSKMAQFSRNVFRMKPQLQFAQ